MKLQQEIVPLFFKSSELVLFKETSELLLSAYWTKGQIEAEARERPGWYYVRDLDSGMVHLVMWTDLKRASDE